MKAYIITEEELGDIQHCCQDNEEELKLIREREVPEWTMSVEFHGRDENHEQRMQSLELGYLLRDDICPECKKDHSHES